MGLFGEADIFSFYPGWDTTVESDDGVITTHRMIISDSPL